MNLKLIYKRHVCSYVLYSFVIVCMLVHLKLLLCVCVCLKSYVW